MYVNQVSEIINTEQKENQKVGEEDKTNTQGLQTKKYVM